MTLREQPSIERKSERERGRRKEREKELASQKSAGEQVVFSYIAGSDF